jgi:rhodanese-related sulfurtransferase
MKELEKTKRISISAVLFILVVIIGVLSFERPKNVFIKGHDLLLNHITTKDYIVNTAYLDTLNSFEDISIIDIRSPYEFSKGHLKNAINIYTPNLLDDNEKTLLKDLESQNKTIILYGSNPDEASGSWMLLTQLGYKNIKILCAEVSYDNNKLIVADYPLEKANINYADFMKDAISNKVETVKKVPKKVIKLIKKKKKVAEGGC